MLSSSLPLLAFGLHAAIAHGLLDSRWLLGAAGLLVGLVPGMAIYGQSGTIYDPPPAHSEVFKVGAADLNLPLGGGFQAAHIWVNNQSNQYLYLPDAPDVVAPGVTRVVAIISSDVARASWTVPAAFAIVQPNKPQGAAILVWVHANVDISPHPGFAQSPTVTSPATQLADLTFPTGASTQTTEAVPSGTHSLQLLFSAGSVGASLASLVVTGHTSGVQYYPTAAAGAAAFFGAQSPIALPLGLRLVITIDAALDARYDITANNGGAAAATVKATAVLDTQAAWVVNSPLTPIFVAISTADGMAALPGSNDGSKRTYRAVAQFAPAAAATDVFVIDAGLGGTVRVTYVGVSITSTTAITVPVELLLRSSKDGVGTAVTAVPLESNDAAASAALAAYTANPALGTLIGIIAIARVAAVLSGTSNPEQQWTFGDRAGTRAIVLHGGIGAHQLCLNLGGVTIAGGTIAIEIEWTED